MDFGWWTGLGAFTLAAGSGFRVFLPLFALALFDAVAALDAPALPGPNVGLWITLALALGEIAADKVARLDLAIGALGLLLRPLVAAGTVAVLVQDAMVAVLAAAVALLVGLGKARLRQESRAAFMGVGDGVTLTLSLAEDVAAALVVGAALLAPQVGATVLVGLLVAVHLAASLVHWWHWTRLLMARAEPSIPASLRMRAWVQAP